MIAYNFIKYVIDLYLSFKMYIDTLNNSHLLGYDMNDIENVMIMQLVCNLLSVAKGWVNIFENMAIFLSRQL